MNRSNSALTAVVLLAASSTLFAQSSARSVPKEFEHVRTMGRALSEFNDDRIQLVAAYYYSQSNHDAPWLLIELGALRQRATAIRRDQIELVTPDGRVVKLATHARWSQDSTRSVLLLQQTTNARHPVSSYFLASNGETSLRFFTDPRRGGTVRNEALLAPNELALGDLFFESPTRLWDKGTYALVVRYDGAEAVLPIELR